MNDVPRPNRPLSAGTGYTPAKGTSGTTGTTGTTGTSAEELMKNAVNNLANVGSAIANLENRNALLQMAEQKSSAEAAMRFNAEEAEKNRQFQKMMSDTQYQRAVADLKKAGLNPILAAGNLSGASTPSGSSAQGVAIQGAAGKIGDATTMMMAAPAIVNALMSVANSALNAISTSWNSNRGENNRLINIAENLIDKGWESYNKAFNLPAGNRKTYTAQN